MGLSDFQKKVFEMSSVTKEHSGFAAKSSFRYVERSFELAGTMPEVAVFLAITAEEEAATALFLALKSKGYLRSSELKMHDHKHKGGLYPFLTLLGVALNSSEVPYQLVVENNNGRDILRTQLKNDDFVLQPDPPLNQVNAELQRHIGATILIHIIYLLVIQHAKQNLVEECVDVYLKVQHNLENKT